MERAQGTTGETVAAADGRFFLVGGIRFQTVWVTVVVVVVVVVAAATAAAVLPPLSSAC